MSILTSTSGPIHIITINRPHARNAVDHDTALAAEFAGGLDILKAGSARDGAARFTEGKGRNGKF